MAVKIPKYEADDAPPARVPFGFFEQLEGRALISTEPVSEPTLEPLRNYLARGGKFTEALRLWLIDALDRDGSSEYTINIHRRSRGRPKRDCSKHREIGWKIFSMVEGSIDECGNFVRTLPVEAAIHSVMSEYKISRQTAFSAKKLVEVESQAAARTPYDPVFRGDFDEGE